MTAKEAQGIEQTGTGRERTVDVLCWSKPVVDDYTKNSNAVNSLNVQTRRPQLLCFDTSSSSDECSYSLDLEQLSRKL